MRFRRERPAEAVHFYPGSIISGFTSCGVRGLVTIDPAEVTCQPCIDAEKAAGIPWPLTTQEYVALTWRMRQAGSLASEKAPEEKPADDTVVWMCHVCGNSYHNMSYEQHKLLRCKDEWLAWNNMQLRIAKRDPARRHLYEGHEEIPVPEPSRP